MGHDTSILEAALIGYQLESDRIAKAMADLRARIGGDKAAPSKAAPPLKKRKLSAAARKRIAAGQRKRWAEYRKQQSETPA